MIATLTDVYREDVSLYEGMEELNNRLIAEADIRVGIITRNITLEPKKTLPRSLSSGPDVHP